VNLVIRNVEVDGRAGLDVRFEGGRIAEVGPGLRGEEDFDGGGGALIPGLCDHHIHLFALAAETQSVKLDEVRTGGELGARIAEAAAARPEGAWVRLTGYHEGVGELTRADLDALAPRHRVRVQHRTGALWVLNSPAMAAVCGCGAPAGVEAETGRAWRADAWLRERIGAEPPPLAEVGRRLAACGITAVTDASVTTDADTADRLADAHRAGALPQRLTLMSGGPLEPPPDGAFAVGPVKVLLDDAALPDFDALLARIAAARAWGRAVAAHCVTAGELAFALAAFEAAGARPGDRIEHGGVIPAAAIPQLRALGLTVVTQPAFIRERGDRYVADVDPCEHDDLYRLATLRRAGVAVAASSDAPYASPDPWLGVATAADRRTLGGARLGPVEAVAPRTALDLYLSAPDQPGGPPRRIEPGAAADLCLLAAPLREVLATPCAAAVRAVWIGGALTHEA
jgi:predicted amidohydrolase YtcJ